MKVLKIVAWGVVIGLYYTAVWIGSTFIGERFGEAVADVLIKDE